MSKLSISSIPKEVFQTPESYREFVLSHKRDIPAFYRLMRIAADKQLRGRGTKRYPKFDVSTTHNYFFTTRKAAEERLLELVKEVANNDYDITYCYYIFEIPLNSNVPGNPLCWDGWESWRRYDAYGNLEDRSYCSASEWGKEENALANVYWGRPEESLRYEEDEIVEVLCGDYVKLMVTTWKGMGFEDYRKRALKLSERDEDDVQHGTGFCCIFPSQLISGHLN